MTSRISSCFSYSLSIVFLIMLLASRDSELKTIVVYGFVAIYLMIQSIREYIQYAFEKKT